MVNLKEELLFILNTLGEIVLTPRRFWHFPPLADIPYSTFRSSVCRAQKSGLIQKKIHRGRICLYLTDKGRKEVLPLQKLQQIVKPKWDGKWRLVSFDVPELNHRERDILRSKLRELGFGKLHQSVWISPHRLIPAVRVYVDNFGFSDFVWLFEAYLEKGKISLDVIKAAWPNLDSINESYNHYIQRWHRILPKLLKTKDQQLLTCCIELAKFELVQIIYADPQLPDELLPKNCGYKTALNLFKKITAIKQT